MTINPLAKFQVINNLIIGYAGYIKGVKAENMIANTFGKITLEVNQDNYVKGQDLDAEHKFVSIQQSNNITPSQMLQRTAADIVGVPNKRVTVKPVIFYLTFSQQSFIKLVINKINSPFQKVKDLGIKCKIKDRIIK